MANTKPFTSHGTPNYTPEMQEAALIDNKFWEQAHNRGYEEAQIAKYVDEYGLYGNEEFRRRAAEKFDQATAENKPIGVIIGDIDGLKTVNDEMGHPAGDKVINRAKAVIAEMMEESDINMMAGRIGGDEFAILCEADSETTKLMAVEFKARYREYVEKPGNGEFKKRGLAFAVGFANSDEPGIEDFSDAMKHSDDNMYKDKQNNIGELTRRKKLGLLAAHGILKMSNIRKRDAPKLWRKMGIID